MAVYGVDGLPVQLLYNESGTQLAEAFDVDGVEVFRQTIDYNNYTVSESWSYVPHEQGMDIYENTVAIWNEQSKSVILKELDSGDTIGTLYTDLTNHGNDISFTDEFYSPNDEFPLLCISGTHFYRITRTGATLEKVFTLPVVGTYNTRYGCAFDGNVMYVAGYKNGYEYSADNDILIQKLDLKNLTRNQDGTYTPAVLNSVVRDWVVCIQGAAYHDGLFWWACGISGSGILYGINPITGEAVYSLSLANTGELEGLGWGYNNTDKWFAFIGSVDKRKYIKVTF